MPSAATAAARPALPACAGLLLALLTACAGGQAGTDPGPVTPAPTASATTATRPEVTWQPADVPGYARSTTPPADGVVELTDPVHACVLQLTHEPLRAEGDDASATARALDEAVAGLAPVGKVARSTGTMTSDGGPLDGLRADLTVAEGPHRTDVRLLLRAVTGEDLLLGIVHICPAGSLDDDVWQAFVAGSTVHGTDAGSL